MTVTYVSAADTQIKMVKLVVSGVLRENTSMIIWLTQVNMIILMIVMYVLMDNIVYKHTILLVVSIVLQVNTCLVAPPVIMRASLTVKYVITVDIAMTDMDLAPGVLRECSSMMMLQPQVNMITRMIAMYVLMDNTVQNNTTRLVSTVTQVNTCLVTPPVIMQASLTVKYVSTVDIAMTDMGLAPFVQLGNV